MRTVASTGSMLEEQDAVNQPSLLPQCETVSATSSETIVLGKVLRPAKIEGAVVSIVQD